LVIVSTELMLISLVLALTEARDVLADTVRRMYEKCIYKDD
jgi:hypothetical protein